MKTKLGLVTMVLLFVVFLASPLVAAAPSVELNGEQLTFDVEPLVEDGRILVPLRVIFEAMGATVVWNQETLTAEAYLGDRNAVLPLNSNTPTVNGAVWPLDVPAMVVQERILAPLRFAGESLGGTVEWRPDSNQVVITAGEIPALPPNDYTPAQIFAQYNDSIVSIDTYDGPGQFLERGTGIIIDASGKIATNYHQIAGAYSGRVKLADGRQFDISGIQDYDAVTDLAVVKVDAANLSPLPIGDSDHVAGGQKVVVMANPFGLQNAMAELVLDEGGNAPFGYEPMYYKGWTINMGTSGGAFIDLQGRLIGIANTRWRGSQWSSYKIPVNKLIPLLAEDRNLTMSEAVKNAARPDLSEPMCRYAVLCGEVSKIDEPIDAGNVFSRNSEVIYCVIQLDQPLNGQLWTYWLDENTILSRSPIEGEGGEGEDLFVSYIEPEKLNLKAGEYSLMVTLADGTTLLTMLEFSLE